jgi:hypothetical protein
MYRGQRRRNAETRFEAVALSVDLVASDAILRLNALYTSEGTLLHFARSGTNRMVVKSSTVPVMVERGNGALPPSLFSDRTVGTGLRYEERKYSGWTHRLCIKPERIPILLRDPGLVGLRT